MSDYDRNYRWSDQVWLEPRRPWDGEGWERDEVAVRAPYDELFGLGHARRYDIIENIADRLKFRRGGQLHPRASRFLWALYEITCDAYDLDQLRAAKADGYITTATDRIAHLEDEIDAETRDLLFDRYGYRRWPAKLLIALPEDLRWRAAKVIREITGEKRPRKAGGHKRTAS